MLCSWPSPGIPPAQLAAAIPRLPSSPSSHAAAAGRGRHPPPPTRQLVQLLVHVARPAGAKPPSQPLGALVFRINADILLGQMANTSQLLGVVIVVAEAAPQAQRAQHARQRGRRVGNILLLQLE